MFSQGPYELYPAGNVMFRNDSCKNRIIKFIGTSYIC